MGPPRAVAGAAAGATGAPPGVPGPAPCVRLVPLTPVAAAAALRGERTLPDGLALAPDWPDESAAPVLGLAAIGHPDAAGGGQWLVVADGPRVAAGAGVVVGLCGVRARHPDGAAEIGYSLAPSARGRAVATVAVGALVRLLTGGPDRPDVVAETGTDNRPSRRLLERLGFALEDPRVAGAGSTAAGGDTPRGRSGGDPVALRYRLRSGT